MDKHTYMTTAPVERLVLSLGAPSIVIMVISALYNMADTYFVGSLGTSEVAAVGIAFPLMAIIQAMGFFFGQGSGNYISRALGAQDTDGASRMVATGLVSGFLVMIALAAAGIVGLRPLVMALGATDTILPHAMQYILYILIASPWMVAATILNQQLRLQGSASIAMAGMIAGAVLNIILDPVFIFLLCMDVEGAAVATMISQLVSFAILFFYGATRSGNIPIKLTHFAPSRDRYGEIFRGGIPALLRQSLMSVATVITNHLAGLHGDAAIAAISIVNRVCMFAGAVILGFGQGFQPVCGFNYGAGLYRRVKRSFWFCVRISAIGMIVAAILLVLFAPEVIALFRKDDSEVIRIGALGLRLNCISFPFIAWIVMCNMLTQTIGKAMEASLLAASRSGLFLLPALLILNHAFALTGIQLSTPVADTASFIFSIPIAIKVLREMRDGNTASLLR